MSTLIKNLFVCVLLLVSVNAHAADVISANVFTLQGSENTHVMLETNQAVSHSMLVLKNPNRIVIDLKNSPINYQLKALAKKNFSDHLCIKQVRIAYFKQGVTRIVFDLKEEVKANLNVYKPQDKYQFRLMLDFFPIEKSEEAGKIDSIKQSKSNHVKKDTIENSSTSSGAKIILEPPAYDEMLMDEYSP